MNIFIILREARYEFIKKQMVPPTRIYMGRDTLRRLKEDLSGMCLSTPRLEQIENLMVMGMTVFEVNESEHLFVA